LFDRVKQRGAEVESATANFEAGHSRGCDRLAYRVGWPSKPIAAVDYNFSLSAQVTEPFEARNPNSPFHKVPAEVANFTDDDDCPSRCRYSYPNTPRLHKDRKPHTVDNRKRHRGRTIHKRDAICILPARISGRLGNRYSAPHGELGLHRVRRLRLSYRLKMARWQAQECRLR
jgi:hypothetical protein